MAYGDKTITKLELLSLLEKYDDDEEIYAWWDDRVWPIIGVGMHDGWTQDEDDEYPCIECP